MANITFPTFPESKKLPFSITPTDSAGVSVPGTYTWSVDNATVATVDVAADTLSAFLVPMANGTVVLTVTDGSISDSAGGSISAAAVALNLTFGTPVPK